MSSNAQDDLDAQTVVEKATRDFSSAARQLAAEALRRVEEDDAYANLVLPSMISASRLNKRDAALATELTYGTLRSQGLYDTIIQFCARRSVNQIDPHLRPVLRMGVHQLLSMRVASHAAVDQSVRLAKAAGGQGAASFVNAVLRSVSEKDMDAWQESLLPNRMSDEVDYLSTLYSHPTWVVRALRESLVGAGRPVSEIDALLRANNDPARVCVALLPGFSHEGLTASAGQWAPTAATLPPGDPRLTDVVADGRARVQDEGSQLAALVAAGAEVDGSDEKWADLCAGPGGKATLMGAVGAERGASVTAFELQPHRAELVRKASAILGDRVTVITGDGRTVGEDFPDNFDRVLADVPCTGLGALRRRPESRWRRTPSDLATLTPLQRELLGSAVDATRPGGLIAYVTCSPHPAETRLVVNDIVRSRNDVTPVDAVDVLLDVLGGAQMPNIEGPMIGTGNAKRRSVQLWPHLHGTDAMFISLLAKG